MRVRKSLDEKSFTTILWFRAVCVSVLIWPYCPRKISSAISSTENPSQAHCLAAKTRIYFASRSLRGNRMLFKQLAGAVPCRACSFQKKNTTRLKTSARCWQISIKLCQAQCGGSSLTDKSDVSRGAREGLAELEWLKETEGYQIAHVRAGPCEIATLTALDSRLGSHNSFCVQFRWLQTIGQGSHGVGGSNGCHPTSFSSFL